jgi:small subunit ribosomal protein S16
LLSIRLTRLGAKKRPFYRIVVTEREAKRDGRFVEILGHYDPISKPVKIKIDRERFDFWVARGAQPSETVRRCLRADSRTAAAVTSGTATG